MTDTANLPAHLDVARVAATIKSHVEFSQVRRFGAVWQTQDRRPGAEWLPAGDDWTALLNTLEADGEIVVGTHSGLAAIA
jgi:hypothetical protein